MESSHDLLWIGIAFLSGALPISVWLGRYGIGEDIRKYGDGNPGAVNVWRAGGAAWGITAVILDFLKGAIPVSLANFGYNIQGWPLVVIALAPILGHAFSPLLKFRGGKALAVTFGVWAGLSTWLVPAVLGLSFGLWLWLLDMDSWAVVAGLLSLLFFMILYPINPLWLVILAGNSLILIWKQREDLSSLPKLNLQFG